MSRNLTIEIIKKLKHNKSAYSFITNLMSDANVYLFGGAIRDFFDDRLDQSRDLDFVVEAKHNDSIDIQKYILDFTDVIYKKNRYDGYKINFENSVTMDIWNLNDTWAFRNYKLSPSPENLIKSVYLNVDALVYSLNYESFLENCDDIYFQVRKERILDIVFDETPYEGLNLLRALVFQKKYSLNLSEELKAKLLDYIKNNKNIAIDNFINIQMSHYNNIILNKNDLLKIFYYLKEC